MSAIPPIPPQYEPRPRPAGLGVALGLALGLMIVIVGAGVGFLAGFLFGQNLGYNTAWEEYGSETFDVRAEGLALVIDTPGSVEVGDVFTIVVRCQNALATERLINSVDFEAALLDGFTILKVEPEPDSITEAYSEYGVREHLFAETIAPNSAAPITFTCRADAPGSFSGDLDVYVDSDDMSWPFESSMLSIEITGEAPRRSPRW